MTDRDILHIFHKSQMERVKKQCKGVQFISHFQDKNKYWMVVNVKNAEGGKDKVTFPLQTTPENMTTKEYDFIIDVINNKEYEGSQIDVR